MYVFITSEKPTPTPTKTIPKSHLAQQQQQQQQPISSMEHVLNVCSHTHKKKVEPKVSKYPAKQPNNSWFP